MFNNKSSKFKLINYFTHGVKSKNLKPLDDAIITKIDVSSSMNYQSKPTPFFNLQYQNQVIKNFERKSRIKIMPIQEQNISKLQPSSPPGLNVFTMLHQEKPTPLFKFPSQAKNSCLKK
jgi:hypothetical protein